MVERTIGQAASAMRGEIVSGAPEAVFNGVAIDSRQAGGGALFFALPGARVDGHAFTQAALNAGAAGIVVQREPESAMAEAPCIRVDDTFAALHDLTHAVRRQVPEKLVGITGSMGKTTTKDLLAVMLAGRFRTAKSPGNLNNTYGFPIALLGIPDDTEWMVAEMGMSTPGELRQVSLLGRPDVAVFTNVRPAHLANFGSVEAIADAKAELLAGLAEDGIVVANADDPHVMRIATRHERRGGRVVRFGLDRPELDLWASAPIPRDGAIGSRFTVHAGENSAELVLPIHGLYNAENALAAAACAYTLGVPLATIATSVAAVSAGAMRGQFERTATGATVINDAYNANPAAVERALESAAAVPGARHVAILGDMLELGPEAASFHRQMGVRAAAWGMDFVVGVGEHSRETVREAQRRGVESSWCLDAEMVVERLLEIMGTPCEDDVILVKGSRGMALERVVEALSAPPADGAVF